jgi:drug/metabolite transporter (DMT)-like permease
VQNKPIVPPYLGLTFGILAVSTASIFIRFAQNEVSSLVVAGYRMSVAALILLPILLLRYRQTVRNLDRGDLVLGLLSGVFLAIHFATWIKSLEYTTVTSSVVLVTTTPLWVALAAPVTIKEPITKRITLGMGLSLIGTVIIGFSDVCSLYHGLSCPPLAEFFGDQALLGDFLALIGAWTAAGYVIIGRRLREKLPVIPYISIVYGIAAVLLILVVIAAGGRVTGFSPQTYLWLVLLGIIPQLIGHTSFNWALGFLPAAFVAISLLGEPIGSSILAFVFLGETPTFGIIFGGVLILAGITIASSARQTHTDQKIG